jgi:NTE family protein
MSGIPVGSIALILLFAVGGCSVVPCCGFDNESASQGRKAGQYGTDEVRSGSHLASLNVDWQLDWNCRNNYNYEPKPGEAKPDPIQLCKGKDERFLGVAISGGGSRAAVFSAAVLFELRKYGILQQVDVISSVSGGSYTSALYALSCDDAESCPATVEGPKRMVWTEDEVYRRLQRNFIARWFGNWFWPNNIAMYWLTDFNRSQIMAKTLDANLFDNSLLGHEGYRFQDLNPQRPYLIINATDFSNHGQKPYQPSSLLSGLGGACGRTRFFPFTQETFAELGSDLDQYRIADAVVASSAFPAVFNYVTLKDFKKKPEQYVHLLDGGPFDNLGVVALLCALDKAENKPGKNQKILMLIDSSIDPQGKSSNEAATRSGLDHFVDTNALDAVDILFEVQRQKSIEEAGNAAALITIDFHGLTREDIGAEDADHLYEMVNGIPTNLTIEDWQADCLKRAAYFLVKSAAARIAAREDDPRFKGLVRSPGKSDEARQPPLCVEPPPEKPKDVGR